MSEPLEVEPFSTVATWAIQLKRELSELRARVAQLEQERRQPTARPPLSVRALVKKYPEFTEASLRWHLFHRAANGLDAAVIQRTPAGRLYLDEEAFLRWWRNESCRTGSRVPKPR